MISLLIELFHYLIMELVKFNSNLLNMIIIIMKNFIRVFKEVLQNSI